MLLGPLKSIRWSHRPVRSSRRLPRRPAGRERPSSSMRRRFGSSRTTPPPIASSAGRWSEAERRNEAQAACDLQTKKEIEVCLHRLDMAGSW